MDSRDDISATRSLLWSNERATLDEVEEKYGFPQIVKMTSETSKIYELPDEEPILIYGRRNLTRTIAHTIEEGDYVMGKQLDISNEFSGSFKLSTDFGRNEVPLKTFSSIQEVAAFFPSKIYVQELLTIKNEDASGKPSTTVLLKGDELTVLNRINMPLPSAKLPIRFGRSKQFSTQIVPGLSCHSTRLNTNISLPLSCKGSFATRTPIEVNAFERTREMPLEQLIESVNFPITVKVATNRSRSPKDDFLLRSGMHLKLIGVEDHNIMVGVAPFNRIIELSPSSWDYYLPSALTQPQENELDLNQYKTYLQNAYMASKIQGSATNVDDYCKSVRFHINRSKRPTKPKPWNKNVNLRSPSQRSSRKVRPAISAIQLLSNQPENHTRTTQGRKQAHRALPMPNTSPSAAGPDCPPLPPRNKATDYSQPPRIPPKTRSSNIFTEPMPLDMPTRAAPVPNLHGNNNTTMQSRPPIPVPSEHSEGIWEVWQPLQSSDSKSKDGTITGSNYENTTFGDRCYPDELTNGGATFSPCTPKEEPINGGSPKFSLHVRQNSPPKLSNYENNQINPEPRQEDRETQSQTDLTLIVSADNNPPLTNGDQDGSMYENALDIVEVQSNGSQMNFDDIASSQANSTHGTDQSTAKDLFVEEETMSHASHRMVDNTTQCKPIPRTYVLPPVDWTPPDNVEEMSVGDVSNALRYIGLSEDIVELFHNERIDGQLLTELNNKILVSEICKLHCFKISRFLSGWRPKLD